MGGRDKGLIEWRGKLLVQHTLERLAPQATRILISANRNLDRYAGFGYPVVVDAETGYPGPLAGLLAGLAATERPWLLSVPCDCPNLPLDLAERLFQAAQQARTSVAVASTHDGLQPTFQLCHQDCLTALRAFLASGERRVSAWCRQQNACVVRFPDARMFDNLNTPEALIPL